jgi:SAM-dependent methyltransferase
LPFLRFAQHNDPTAPLTAGDALCLPFSDSSFDIAACHFLLLWLAQPGMALAEMRRVTRKGGAVIAFAEPDYGGRIDYPEALEELGRLQTAGIRQQGADPELGRKLSGLFHAAGLQEVETGLLGGQWRGAPSQQEIDLEWGMLAADLKAALPVAQMEKLHEIETAAWRAGQRVLFVPTFYAIGKK